MVQMIHGTDIQIFDGTGTKIIQNVLIGDPSEAELIGYKIPVYLLAIPKEDMTDWIDRKVTLFGNTFRTVGHPQQGMDINIPLRWNKKVRAELLLTNGSCTVYEKDTFQKHSFPDVLISDRRGERTVKTGAQSEGDLRIYVYAVNCTDYYIPKPGDLLVAEDCQFVFDTSTQAQASESMTQFRANYKGFAVIKNTEHKYSGNLPDLLITAR